MPLTDAEFENACRSICVHCRNGASLRQRIDTREYIHDIGKKPVISQTICGANKIRLERQNG